MAEDQIFEARKHRDLNLFPNVGLSTRLEPSFSCLSWQKSWFGHIPKSMYRSALHLLFDTVSGFLASDNRLYPLNHGGPVSARLQRSWNKIGSSWRVWDWDRAAQIERLHGGLEAGWGGGLRQVRASLEVSGHQSRRIFDVSALLFAKCFSFHLV